MFGFKKRFNGFLLVSAGIHAAMLLAFLDTRPLPGHRETVLSVSLIEIEQPATPVAGSTSVVPKRHGENAKVNPIAPDAAKSAFDRDAENTTASAGDNTAAAPETLRAQVESRLLAQLDPYFHKHYPRLAQRQGWQGKVLLAFTVMPDGDFERIQVAQSSGYDVLDRAAVSSLRRFGNHANVAHWLRGKALEIKLPVIYRLTDY